MFCGLYSTSLYPAVDSNVLPSLRGSFGISTFAADRADTQVYFWRQHGIALWPLVRSQLTLTQAQRAARYTGLGSVS